MHDDPVPVLTPDHPEPQAFDNAARAVARLEELYAQATGFLVGHFSQAVQGGKPASRIRASSQRCSTWRSRLCDVNQ